MSIAVMFAELADLSPDNCGALELSVGVGWVAARYLVDLSANLLGPPALLTVDIGWDVVRHCGKVSEGMLGHHCCYQGVDRLN